MSIKVLVVASNNSEHPFVFEQMEAVSALGVECELFGISGKGMRGYLSNLPTLRKKISQYEPDLVHAHYGLSGLLSNLQRQVPVVTTYHGSDIHSKKAILLLSKIAMKLSAYNIFVGQSLFDLSKYRGNRYLIQSCGLDMDVVKPVSRLYAREQLGIDTNKDCILFGGSFDNPIKNPELAKQSVEKVGNCSLIELKGYSKREVGLLMNACNLLLVTSLRESGPLVVKEAMACGCPVVSTDVGDVRWVLGQTDGCYITSYDTNDCAQKIQLALKYSLEHEFTAGRARIEELGLDNADVAKKIVEVYKIIAKCHAKPRD